MWCLLHVPVRGQGTQTHNSRKKQGVGPLVARVERYEMMRDSETRDERARARENACNAVQLVCSTNSNYTRAVLTGARR